MHIPRHEELGIVLQDEHFLDRKRWDFDATPPEKHPLLLHYHPLELYRHQVIKQTDVVLATYLVGHHFTEEEKRRTFDYYDPLTTGDSTLSACIQSVIASEVGYADAALDYFLDACAVDLPTSTATPRTASTSPPAAAPGSRSWPASAACATPTATSASAPGCPAAWDRLRFRVQVRGQLIEVDMTHGRRPTPDRRHGIPIEHLTVCCGSAPGAEEWRPAHAGARRPAARRLGIAGERVRQRRPAGLRDRVAERRHLLDRRRLDVLWFRAHEVRLVARGRRVDAPVGQSFGQRAAAQRIPCADGSGSRGRPRP